MKKITSLLFFATITLNGNAQSPLTNQIDSVSYLIGQSIANNVLREMSEANKDMVMKGLGDGLYQNQALCADPGNTILNSYYQEKKKLQDEQAEKDNQLTKLAGEKFLEDNKNLSFKEKRNNWTKVSNEPRMVM